MRWNWASARSITPLSLAVGLSFAGLSRQRQRRLTAVQRASTSGSRWSRFWSSRDSGQKRPASAGAECLIKPANPLCYDDRIIEEEAYTAMCSQLEGKGFDCTDICELAGWELQEEIARNLHRKLHVEERQIAWNSCGFFQAHRGLEAPIALWLVGPSASDKGRWTLPKAQELGLGSNGWVLLEGELFREAHKGFMAARQDGQRKHCVWWDAYTSLRPFIDEEKKTLLKAVMEQRMHVVIPSTCLLLEDSLAQMEELKSEGYLCHVIGLCGDREEIARRGHERAVQEGKQYEPREYDAAMRALKPMMKACNGRFQVVSISAADAGSVLASGAGPQFDMLQQAVCKVW